MEVVLQVAVVWSAASLVMAGLVARILHTASKYPF